MSAPIQASLSVQLLPHRCNQRASALGGAVISARGRSPARRATSAIYSVRAGTARAALERGELVRLAAFTAVVPGCTQNVENSSAPGVASDRHIEPVTQVAPRFAQRRRDPSAGSAGFRRVSLQPKSSLGPGISGPRPRRGRAPRLQPAGRPVGRCSPCGGGWREPLAPPPRPAPRTRARHAP